MSKSRIKVVTRKAKPYVLHEFNEKGQHRLVLVQEEGNETSGWYEHHAVGEFKGLLFCAGAWPLKPGVFRQVHVESRPLISSNGVLGCSVASSSKTELRRS